MAILTHLFLVQKKYIDFCNLPVFRIVQDTSLPFWLALESPKLSQPYILASNSYFPPALPFCPWKKIYNKYILGSNDMASTKYLIVLIIWGSSCLRRRSSTLASFKALWVAGIFLLSSVICLVRSWMVAAEVSCNFWRCSSLFFSLSSLLMQIFSSVSAILNCNFFF